MVGLVALVVVGVAVIGYGAWSDRARNRRAAAAVMAPPERVIPGFEPAGRGPAYVSDLQARRRPQASSTSLGGDVAGSDTPGPDAGLSTVDVRAGWASADFATDPERQQAVLEGPWVLVCEDRVETVRELLPVLEPALRAQKPVVVVAPEVAREVLATLEVNAIQGKLAVLVVRANDGQRTSICAASGATPVDCSDRQSGYVTADRLGRLTRWTSTRDASYLVEAG